MKIKDAIKELDKHPDDDVWKAVDAALQEIAALPTRPPGSFTVTEMAARKGINRDKAARLVKKLLDSGKINKVSGGNSTYYVMVRDKKE